MAETLTVTSERVDDIPLLLAQISKMGIPVLMDRFFIPHGNWSGTSLGWTASIWLAHLLSRGDHRLSWVEKWVAKRIETLEVSTGQVVRLQEWSDDRLGIVLDALSQPEPWQGFEAALNRHTLRVYDLQAERVRALAAAPRPADTGQ